MAAYIASASRNKYGLHIKFRIIVRFMLGFFRFKSSDSKFNILPLQEFNNT
jgi:hypothetical protein